LKEEEFKIIDDPQKRKEYIEWTDKKHMESREVRSTVGFYDKTFWEYWKTRFHTEAREDNPVVIQETEKKRNFVKEHLPDVTQILDVACSFGHFVSMMRKEGYDAHGSDISKEAISKAPKSVAEYVKIADIQKLPYEDNTFQLVTAFDILEHLYVEEFMLAIKEVNRVAREFILIRIPAISYGAEPWLSDLSEKFKEVREHVSVYPWDFWVRRFVELDKFKWSFVKMWDSYHNKDFCEAWIIFTRIK